MEEKIKKDILRLPSISGDRSFITDISKSKESPTQDRIQEYHNAIKQQMFTLNQDLDSVLQRHEQDFLNAFKYQMYNLYSQIKELKKAASNTGVNQKHNEELRSMQKSMEKYKKEALKLSKKVEEQDKEIAELKGKKEELNSDCKLFKSKLKSAKRKLKLRSVEKHYEQTLITTVDTSPLPPPCNKYTPYSKSGKIIEDLLSRYKRTDAELFRELESVMERQSKHFEESTRHYKSIISNEKRKMLTFSVMHSSMFSEKSEMENLFLDCVEEVKKEIGHRRAKSLRSQKFPLKSKLIPNQKLEMFSAADKRKILELLISNEQVLIMLYEKLFPYRASQYGSPSKLDTTEGAPDMQDLLSNLPIE